MARGHRPSYQSLSTTARRWVGRQPRAALAARPSEAVKPREEVDVLKGAAPLVIAADGAEVPTPKVHASRIKSGEPADHRR
jgi:hypothetical protein